MFAHGFVTVQAGEAEFEGALGYGDTWRGRAYEWGFAARAEVDAYLGAWFTAGWTAWAGEDSDGPDRVRLQVEAQPWIEGARLRIGVRQFLSDGFRTDPWDGREIYGALQWGFWRFEPGLEAAAGLHHDVPLYARARLDSTWTVADRVWTLGLAAGLGDRDYHARYLGTSTDGLSDAEVRLETSWHWRGWTLAPELLWNPLLHRDVRTAGREVFGTAGAWSAALTARKMF